MKFGDLVELVFVNDFDGDLLLREQMLGEFDYGEFALAERVLQLISLVDDDPVASWINVLLHCVTNEQITLYS